MAEVAAHLQSSELARSHVSLAACRHRGRHHMSEGPRVRLRPVPLRTPDDEFQFSM